MIAGGTGITPLLQVIEEVLADAGDETEMSLIYANKTVADIFLRDRDDFLASKYPTRFKVRHVLSRSKPAGWTQATGHVTADLIERHLPAPSADALVLLCGPQAMLDNAASPALDALGYDLKRRVVF
ncbi:hypothetical protein M885DRAFT_526110 [Pelagophyceae sp. CCMP2097]|nr:hypothetical protein M885DRAFT_526110 [Pelagophyceae sp. CCMP2097]